MYRPREYHVPMAGPVLHPDVRAAHEFLQSPAGRRAAETLIRKSRLPIDPGDLVVDAVHLIWATFDRNPLRARLDNVKGYCVTVMKNIIRRTRIGRDVPLDENRVGREDDYDGGDLDPSDFGDVGDPVDGSDEPSNSDDPHRDMLPVLRTLIETTDSDVAARSAALSFLVLEAEPDIHRSDLPSPLAGARPDQAVWWPCIHLARRDPDLFPGGGRNPAAQRQALKRAVDKASAVIDRVRAGYAMSMDRVG